MRRAVRARRRAEADEVRRFTRRSRRRRRIVAAAAGILAVAVLTPVGLAVSPAFSVRQIVVTGADSSLAASLRTALQSQIGTPLALVDATAVRRTVAAQPLVQTYSLEMLPPSTLEVRVVPRVPIAQTAAGGGYRLVDAAGVVLKTSPGLIPGYPLVDAIGTGAAGERAFAGAAAVVLALPTTVLQQVTRVKATSRDGVELTLRGGRRVVWGSADDSAGKAAALRAALRHAADGVSLIDVSAPGLVTTR